MKCNFCGREWGIETPGVMFCPFCGVPLSISPEMSFESETTEKKAPPRLQVERKRYEEGDRDEWGIYTGEVVGEKRDGYGVMEYGGSVRYEGEWKNYTIHGYGKYTFANGNYYEGYFENYKQVKGKMTYTDGTSYYGDWKNGKRHGFGVRYNKLGDVITVGVWKDDKCEQKLN